MLEFKGMMGSTLIKTIFLKEKAIHSYNSHAHINESRNGVVFRGKPNVQHMFVNNNRMLKESKIIGQT